MLQPIDKVFSEAKYQHCIVHFYRNVFSVIPRDKVHMADKKVEDSIEKTYTFMDSQAGTDSGSESAIL